VLIHVEVALEDAARRTPIRVGRRLAVDDVVRELAAREEPHTDLLGGPLDREGSAASFVEAIAECQVGRIFDAAALIVGLAWSVDGAVVRNDFAGEVFALNLDLCGSVESHSIGELLIDALEDVDLAIVRPLLIVNAFRNGAEGRLTSGPTVQKAGQVPQIPPGIWTISAIIKKC
jgi:hypothetical protein